MNKAQEVALPKRTLPLNEKFTIYLDDEGDYFVEPLTPKPGEHIGAHGDTPDKAIANMVEVLEMLEEMRGDHGVGSEQVTGEPQYELCEQDEDDDTVALTVAVAKLRKELAEREAVIEKVRKMVDKQLPHSGACLDQNPDGTFNGKIKCRCSKIDQELREALASPSTILSAHDAEVRRETIAECIKFILEDIAPSDERTEIVAALRTRKEEK